jgi:aerobic carbon-monoxide dehydrogenase large subunit
MSLVNRYIGAPVKRVEDFRFLRGRGEFVADLTHAETLHAAILRGSVAHARIRAIDPKPALAIAGVHAVITAAEIGTVPKIPLRLQPSSATEPFCQPVIAQDRVRYVGEPIAVVLANSAVLAENGVEAIGLDLEELPVVADRFISHRRETFLFEDAGTNLVMQFTAVSGDADAAFRDAEYTKRAHFAVQRHTALPLEPRGLLAQWDAAAGRLTVKGAAKVPFFNRRTVAQMMGLPVSAVDLIENDVGGGFGARGEFYPEDFLIPFAARYVGRPVVWIESRREHLTAINHARQMDCEVEIACKRDGTILGLRGDVYVDLGAYVRTNGLIAPRNVVQLFSGPYRIPNIRLTC